MRGNGAAIVLIVIAYFVAGWSFRLTVFGSVFCWDFLTLRKHRFTPKDEIARACATTTRWARRCLAVRREDQAVQHDLGFVASGLVHKTENLDAEHGKHAGHEIEHQPTEERQNEGATEPSPPRRRSTATGRRTGRGSPKRRRCRCRPSAPG